MKCGWINNETVDDLSVIVWLTALPGWLCVVSWGISWAPSCEWSPVRWLGLCSLGSQAVWGQSWSPYHLRPWGHCWWCSPHHNPGFRWTCLCPSLWAVGLERSGSRTERRTDSSPADSRWDWLRRRALRDESPQLALWHAGLWERRAVMGPETYLRGSSPTPSESDAGVVVAVVAAGANAAGGGGDAAAAAAAASEPATPWGPPCSAPVLFPTAADWVWTSHPPQTCPGPSGPPLQDWAWGDPPGSS